MAHKNRKINKKRGSRTCGYGNTQRHRGAGSRGGRGSAGSKKQKWSFFSKYEPNHFGKTGFKRYSAIGRKLKVINVGELSESIPLLIKEKKAETKGKKYYIDLRAIGYDKLLGSGEITESVVVKIDNYSERALKKIEEAGGKIESENEVRLR